MVMMQVFIGISCNQKSIIRPTSNQPKTGPTTISKAFLNRVLNRKYFNIQTFHRTRSLLTTIINMNELIFDFMYGLNAFVIVCWACQMDVMPKWIVKHL